MLNEERHSVQPIFLSPKPPLANVLWHHLMEHGFDLQGISETPDKCVYPAIVDVGGEKLEFRFSTMEKWCYLQGEFIFPQLYEAEKVLEVIRFFNRLNEVLRMGRFYFSERTNRAAYESMLYCREAKRSHPRIVNHLVEVCTDTALT
jgi:hypothetical protein